MEWSGYFEPNTVKHKRGSMWVKTITIFSPPSDPYSMSHTFPITMGLKSASHEAVEKKFTEELLPLSQQSPSNTMYLHRSECMVVISVAISAILMDQPER
jgi:hypothetical protein